MSTLECEDCATPVSLPQAVTAQELEICFDIRWPLVMAVTKHFFAFRSGAFCCVTELAGFHNTSINKGQAVEFSGSQIRLAAVNFIGSPWYRGCNA